MADPILVPVAEAAQRLGLTIDTIRQHIRRGKLRAIKGNDRRVRVWIEVSAELDNSDKTLDRPLYRRLDRQIDEPTRQDQLFESRVEIELRHQLRAAQADIVTERAKGAADCAQLRADMETVRCRHDAEIERLVAQFHAERSFWTERADAAECRAEQATTALNDLVSRVLALVPESQSSWWARWFGSSRRSDIRGGV